MKFTNKEHDISRSKQLSNWLQRLTSAGYMYASWRQCELFLNKNFVKFLLKYSHVLTKFFISDIKSYLPVIFADSVGLVRSTVVTAVRIFKVTLKPDPTLTLNILQAGMPVTTKQCEAVVVVVNRLVVIENHLRGGHSVRICH